MPRAVVCHECGPYENLKLEEVPALGTPESGKVNVRVVSVGLCFPDILVALGKHVFKMPQPFVPCNEFCGTVSAVGAGCKLKVGDVIYGRSATVNGTLRDEVSVEEQSIYKAPAGELNPHVLAGLETNYGTTYHALKDVAKLKTGERLCVLGASGATGISAIELGKAMGATVVACASSSEKLAACKDAGADVLIDYSKPDFKKRLKDDAGGPLDVVYDPVGGSYSEVAMRALGFGGRFLVIGFASGGTEPNNAIPKFPINLALLNERQILGVLWGTWKFRHPDDNRKNVGELVAMIESGKLRPRKPTIFPIERFKDAMDVMMRRQAIGKICLSTGATLAKL